MSDFVFFLQRVGDGRKQDEKYFGDFLFFPGAFHTTKIGGRVVEGEVSEGKRVSEKEKVSGKGMEQKRNEIQSKAD